jgi:NADPH-dependent 2,4-dienoyl-CoA reductase/sulfur reductase-like enzyme
VAERHAASVVVVGAGPAGLAAAAHAAEAGATTLLLDSGARGGGQIWRHRGAPPPASRRWLSRMARSGASARHGATVIDAPAPGRLLVEEDGRGLRVEYERLVLATGARELLLPFPGWTLPGVLGAGAAQAMLKAGARCSGLRALVAGSGPLLLPVAASLRADGARIVALAEQAPWSRVAAFGAGLARHPRRLAEGLAYGARLLGVPYRFGTWVRAAEGQGTLERVLLTDGRREWTVPCDVLACGFGLLPNLELPRLLGCHTAAGRVVLDGEQRTSVPEVFAAGELGGIAGVDHALVTGAIAGLAAARRPVPEVLRRRREQGAAFAERLALAFAPREELRHLARSDTVVCRCEDTPLGRIDPGGDLRQAKLHGRAGMGPCQGRVCGAALSFLLGFEPDTVRPPLSPVPLSLLEDET